MNLRFFRLFWIILFFLCFPSLLFAVNQSQNSNVNISLVVRDSKSNSPLELVTAVLYRLDKTDAKEVFAYALSDSSGHIVFNRLPFAEYEISLQYMGYFMEIISEIKFDIHEVLKGNRSRNMGVIRMKENPVELEAAIVRDRVKPVVYLGDTIQYNAAAFNLSDSDMLEDFFKKLPGWSVDNNGRITANGKIIEQITINGRVFFMNDPVFVSRNIPAKILKNIKLFEKQSQRAMFSGVDDGKRTNTVDVTVKEDMLKGWLGNLTAGTGTNSRVKNKGFVANFNKYNQVAIIGNYSNVTENIGSPAAYGPGSKDYDFGVNSNIASKKNNFEADISYSFKGRERVVDKSVYRVNYLQDSSFVNDNILINNSENTVHEIKGVVRSTGGKTMIVVNPRASFSNNINFRDDYYKLYGGLSGSLLFEGQSSDLRRTENKSLSTDIQITRKTNKRNRTIGFDGSISYSDGIGNGSFVKQDESEQQYFSDNNKFELSAAFNFTEPFIGKTILGVNYRISSGFLSVEKRTYRMDVPDGTFLPSLSEESDNVEIIQKIDFFLQKPKAKGEKSFLQVGISFLPSYLKRDSPVGGFDKWFSNFSPNLQYRYTSSNLFLINLSYNGSVLNPDMGLLAPVPDNTNPLYFRIGNKDLESEQQHRVNISLRKLTDMRAGFASGILLSTDASFFQNRIINKSWYEQDGVQYSMPVNASGDYSVASSLLFDLPVFDGKASLYNSLSYGLYSNISFINGLENITKRRVLGDVIKFSLNIGNLSLHTGASIHAENSSYSVHSDKTNRTWRSSVDGSVRYQFPYGLEIKTALSYQSFKGFTTGEDKPYLLWNADISKTVVRNKLIFTVSARDILNQNKCVQYQVSDFYIQETRNSVVRQYFLFSVTYKFFTGGKGAAFRNRVNSLLRTNEKLLQKE